MACVFAVVASPTTTASADILADWNSVGLPAPPALKPVALDGKTTALLVMDMMKENCGARPRCPPTVPTIKALMERARAAGALIAYSLPGGGEIIDPGIAPHEGEVITDAGSLNGADKFLGSDLEQRLRARGIKTVIVTGTSAQGVGIGTGSAASQRGFDVVYPIDAVSSEDAFRELYAAWHMGGGGPPIVTRRVIVTRSGMMTF